jgi:UDP-glucose 4-epimerase
VLDAFLHHQVVDLPGAIIIRGDYGDSALLRSIFSSYDISTVMHFAGFIEVGRSVVAPADFYENNVIKTKRLLDIMHSVGVAQLIFSSSCAIYKPLALAEKLTENHQILPLSPYGKTKYAVECLLQDYAVAYGLRYVALRYFNAAGAHIDGDTMVGELHEPETHLIPNIFRAITNNVSITLFGNDYPTSDGTCVRDYIHVRDLAQAHLKSLNYLACPDALSAAFNLGTGHGFSVAEVVAAVENACRVVVNVEHRPRRPGDAPYLVADPGLAMQKLSWRAEYSSLKRIVQDSWFFYQTINKQKHFSHMQRSENAL